MNFLEETARSEIAKSQILFWLSANLIVLFTEERQLYLCANSAAVAEAPHFSCLWLATRRWLMASWVNERPAHPVCLVQSWQRCPCLHTIGSPPGTHQHTHRLTRRKRRMAEEMQTVMIVTATQQADKCVNRAGSGNSDSIRSLDKHVREHRYSLNSSSPLVTSTWMLMEALWW